MNRAEVERMLMRARAGWREGTAEQWRDAYAEHVRWLLAQIDRLETERVALADILAREVVP